MGIKGDKNTEAANLTAMEMEEKLASIGKISTKRMFGGHGLFHDGKMFGMIDSKGQQYLKADDSLIPAEVVDDLDELLSWAKSAINATK